MKPLGIALVIIGIAALVFGGVGFNRQKTVFEVGGMQAMVTEHQNFPLSSAAGILAIVGGVVLVVVAKRRVA